MFGVLLRVLWLADVGVCSLVVQVATSRCSLYFAYIETL
jgi:hypothetical protein